MHPPACMNGRKKNSRPKNGRILPPFGGLKSDEKKWNLNRPRRHWWAPLGYPTPSWRPPDHILPPSLTFLPSAAPSPSNVENNINYQKQSHNIPKIPPKFPIFDPHIPKGYDSDFFFFNEYHRINSFSANIGIALWATPLARYDLSPTRTFTYGTEEAYIIFRQKEAISFISSMYLSGRKQALRKRLT